MQHKWVYAHEETFLWCQCKWFCPFLEKRNMEWFACHNLGVLFFWYFKETIQSGLLYDSRAVSVHQLLEFLERAYFLVEILLLFHFVVELFHSLSVEVHVTFGPAENKQVACDKTEENRRWQICTFSEALIDCNSLFKSCFCDSVHHGLMRGLGGTCVVEWWKVQNILQFPAKFSFQEDLLRDINGEECHRVNNVVCHMGSLRFQPCGRKNQMYQWLVEVLLDEHMRHLLSQTLHKFFQLVHLCGACVTVLRKNGNNKTKQVHAAQRECREAPMTVKPTPLRALSSLRLVLVYNSGNFVVVLVRAWVLWSLLPCEMFVFGNWKAKRSYLVKYSVLNVRQVLLEKVLLWILQEDFQWGIRTILYS